MLTGIAISLQTPYVQNKLVDKATEYLSKTLNFPIKIERVNISWFDKIKLEDLRVYDQKKGKMIHVGESEIDFKITSLLKAKVEVEEVTLENGSVSLIRYKDGNLNINDFIDALSALGSPTQDSTPPKPFTIPSVKVRNMKFNYEDTQEPHIPDFDHYHFGFDSIFADVSNLLVVNDTFQINVKDLRTYETNTYLRVHDIDVLYTFSKNNMEFENLSAHIGDSYVKNYLNFHYKDIDDLSEFNEKVIVSGNLKNSKVSMQDLALFAPSLKPYHDKVTITGDFKGKVTNWGVRNLALEFGKNSLLKGNLKFNGLPDIQETFMELNFVNSKVEAKDMKQYLDPNSYAVIAKLGTISGSGKFVGFPYDFVANGKFETNLGKFVSDINLKTNENSRPSSYYKGSLKTMDFNFGKLIGYSDIFGLLDMDGKIEGRGFSLEEANLKLDAKIKRIGINNYDYKNIITNARLSKRLFNGELSINDSNLVFNANGKVDLNKGKDIFNIQAHIEKANLKPLNLSDIETLVKTDVNFDFKGIHIDSVVGEASLSNTYLLYNGNKEVFLDLLRVRSLKFEGQRTFNLMSDLATIDAHGNFEFSRLAEDIQTLYKEYKLNAKNNSQEIANYYNSKKHNHSNKYEIDFFVNLKDINSILSIYVPNLYLSKDINLSGDFTSGYTTILNINTKVDTVYYNESEFIQNNFELSASKISDSTSVLGMIYLNSEEQKLKSFSTTENFYFEGDWYNNTIDFRTKISQKNSSNKASLIGNLNFLHDKELLTLRESEISLLGKIWNITDDNKILFGHNEISFEDFVLSNNLQSLTLEGTVSDKENKKANLKINNFQIETINPLLSSVKFKGLLNGNIEIYDLYKDLNMEGDLILDDFYVDGFLIGDVRGTSEYDNTSKTLGVEIGVERLDNKIIDIKGSIIANETGKDEKLELMAYLDNANLDILNPILGGALTEMEGEVTGKFKIGGTVKEVTVIGEGDVKKGKFKVPYLGTTYYFEDNIYMDENLIGFKKLKLKDTENNIAILDGGFYHDHFRNFVVEIKAKMKEFKVLNTVEKDNNLFYGNAVVSGDLEILGSFSNLDIVANAKSNKGTRIYIPLNSNASYEKQSYINFVSSKEKDKKSTKDSVDLSGIKLEFNLEITPDAYAEIIFDKRAGDIIRGNGQGNIKMNIDTRGDFNMYGTYKIIKGAYNFTLAGLINKEFNILPNSSITWTGDPYSGNLDIKATYSQYVSLAPLLDSTKKVQPENRRKYPVDVLLGLEGELLAPHITLDIDIVRFPGPIAEEVTGFESKIKLNKQELERQVFSLLILASLQPENSFSGIASTGNNLSELLSNQLSNWLSQVDENLQIDINLNSLDKDALNTFQLRMTYTLLDGRLRISRDGSFQNVQSTQQANFTNIAGEWTVEYLLNKDGKFRFKLYNKANQNMLLSSTGNNANNSTAGFSILHTQSFDKLKDLFNFKKKKPVSEDSIPDFSNFGKDLETKDEKKGGGSKSNNEHHELYRPQRKKDEN